VKLRRICRALPASGAVLAWTAGGLLTLDVLLLDAPVYAEYMPVPELYSAVPRGRPVRYTISLAGRKIVSVSPIE